MRVPFHSSVMPFSATASGTVVFEGAPVGTRVGGELGTPVGMGVGDLVVDVLGVPVGAFDGVVLGNDDGIDDGDAVGGCVRHSILSLNGPEERR